VELEVRSIADSGPAAVADGSAPIARLAAKSLNIFLGSPSDPVAGVGAVIRVPVAALAAAHVVGHPERRYYAAIFL
jgi:hypothetical protein